MSLAETLVKAQELAKAKQEAEAKAIAEKFNSVDYVNSVMGPWGDIIPFAGMNSLPNFPINIFPDWLRSFVQDESIATQTPIDLSAMLVLAVLGTCLAKKVEIELRPGWREPVNLWTIISLPPGNRKSAVFRDVTNPILEWEREERNRIMPDIKRAEAQKKVMEGQVAKLQQSAIKAKDLTESGLATEEAAEIALKLEQMEQPVIPRLVMDDVTSEALGRVMFEQAGKIAILSAEGGLFDAMAGRYSQTGTGNLDTYLKGHSGDMLRIERIGRESNYIENPALTLGLAVQPEVLHGLVDKPGFRGRGLLARFLYSLPMSTVGYRDLSACPVQEKVLQTYGENIWHLLDIEMPDTPYISMLSNEADAVFRGFERWLEPQLRPFGLLEAVTDWSSKLAGGVGRIACLIHIAANVLAIEPWNIPINRNTMQLSVSLAQNYLIHHAKAGFTLMGIDEVTEKAKHLLRWIERKQIIEFTKRQAHYELQGTFRKADELDTPLKMLTERNYIRERLVPIDQGRPGRKPSPIFEVNPAMTQLIELTQLEGESDSVNTVNSIMPSNGPENAPNWLMGGTI